MGGSGGGGGLDWVELFSMESNGVCYMGANTAAGGGAAVGRGVVGELL